MQLGVLFWFYRDAALCENRLRLLRRRNRDLPVFGLYGGPPGDSKRFESRLGHLLDDYWAFPDDADVDWKWRNGDLMLTRWFTERGADLRWGHVFVAQWDMVVTAKLSQWLPQLGAADMLMSGVRPVREVESWWRWTRWDETKAEYDAMLAKVTQSYGPVEDPMCCQFVGLVAPRAFFESYRAIEEPELGFLEYKVPIYAQAFGIRLVPDQWFRPWWPEEPATSGARRRDRVMHAWGSPVPLPLVVAESLTPGGRRAFHPYRGVYPHDLASVADAVRLRAERRGERSTAS